MPMNPDFSQLDINDFKYPLPDERIAKYPKPERDGSKLLIHHHQKILEDHFRNISTHLPAGSLLVVNNTRVVRARLFFRKPTGALIEIFCLEPAGPVADIQLAFQQKGEAVWQCMVGNARRWKSERLAMEFESAHGRVIIYAEKVRQQGGTFLIQFRWDPKLTFAEVLEVAGKIPLPPYLHREAIDSDTKTYQTVYARFDGSVAAPTAGLHFTDRVFQTLREKDISISNLTLHVGAGTFKPVGQEGLSNHEMHTEQILVSKDLLEQLLQYQGRTIAVGTTSVRTLESLYWFGAKLKQNPEAGFDIGQFDPYRHEPGPPVTPTEAIQQIINLMNRRGLEVIGGSTQLMIVPGYQFRMINGMITNFHQPGSTLLLLISAWLGDEWKRVYQYALDNNFRFLSYGDSCLFL
jgi:S-adenosylmethionine:tRNA ribosyltransferase-isomerase